MYIVVSSILSIAERWLRSIIWMNNLDQIITTKIQPSFTMVKEVCLCGGLLLLRYAICSRRHIWAYYSAIQKRNLFLINTQQAWLKNPLYLQIDPNVIQQTTSLIEKLGKQIEQKHARIAIDLIPGLTSLYIGIYQLIYYIDNPMCYVCIAYIFILEVIYTFISQHLIKIEENVYYKNNNANVNADKIEINIETRKLKISMKKLEDKVEISTKY